jgi:hypothetical protein
MCGLFEVDRRKEKTNTNYNKLSQRKYPNLNLITILFTNNNLHRHLQWQIMVVWA